VNPIQLRVVHKKLISNNGVNGARMAGDERRLQILRVAMRLFSQKGFRGTTTKEIAAAAGVSEAMVFRHFANKDELYSAILDHKACLHDEMDPLQRVSDAIERKDDHAVFEGIALGALEKHDCDPEFQRLLLHSALEQHELAHMFWDKFVRRVYRSLGSYIRQRQIEGAIVDVEPAVVVRAFIGMVMHHSLNNNLWDHKQSLLRISNEVAAREFANILLHGVASAGARGARGPYRTLKSAGAALVAKSANGRGAGLKLKSLSKEIKKNSRRKRSVK
jgi:AcrR family transcriptional regulator